MFRGMRLRILSTVHRKAEAVSSVFAPSGWSAVIERAVVVAGERDAECGSKYVMKSASQVLIV